MSRLYGLKNLVSPPVITPSSRCAIGGAMSRLGVGAAASGVSPWSDAANTVLAFPFVIESMTTFYKGFWVNGSAAGGNTDVAIYSENYEFIVGTGAATAGSGSSLPQSVAFTASTTLPPGLYYAGISHSATTTNQLFRWSVATLGIGFWMANGCWKFADAPPIAGTATPADYTNVAFPLFGLITRSGFDV